MPEHLKQHYKRYDCTIAKKKRENINGTGNQFNLNQTQETT